MRNQDALDQKRKLDSLILSGPLMPAATDVSVERLPNVTAGLITRKSGVKCLVEDLAHVELKVGGQDENRAIFVRSGEAFSILGPLSPVPTAIRIY